MCGIFGFISNGESGPNIIRLKKIAKATESRGKHAFGLAWVDRSGCLSQFKRTGSASDRIDDLDMVCDAVAVIGHCRWATHGEPAREYNNHPHRAGAGLFVHNGVVRNYRDIAARHNLEMETECDSEVLGLLMAKTPGPIVRRARVAVESAVGNLAVLGLWANPLRFLVARNGNPLSFGSSRRGVYFASLPDSLPDNRKSVANQYVTVLRSDFTKVASEQYTQNRFDFRDKYGVGS